LEIRESFAKVLHFPHQYSVVMESLLWLLLEAGVALALLLLIVWWTWPRKKTREERNTTDADRQ
jgi:hypothetical protein